MFYSIDFLFLVIISSKEVGIMCTSFYINSLDPKASFKIRDYLCRELSPVIKENRPIIFICIGSDRSTGDALGPLIGEKIKFLSKNNIFIYGTLEETVHAGNLKETVKIIKSKHKKPFIIAIDACLGAVDNVGHVLIEKRPLKPGIALNKDLPEVGDLSILGIVNISGSLEFMVLQNTRLYTVMLLANAISNGIHHCILKSVGFKKNILDSTLENIL